MPEVISIIGGGWSAREVDLSHLPGTIIGVNDSAIHACCDICVSMDRLWTEYRWPILRQRRMRAWIRKAALKNVIGDWPGLNRFDCDDKSVEFSEDSRVLNGPNSGFCALNLAYLMHPERIYLVGFDMVRGPKGEAYWFPPYSWTGPGGATSNGQYAAWARQFDGAAAKCKAAGMEVLNVSRASAIDAFPKLLPEAFYKEVVDCQ
jgi:hypothetical protein